MEEQKKEKNSPHDSEKTLVYIARDSKTFIRGTDLFVYFDEPEKYERGFWNNGGEDCIPLDKDLFPQIKATDEKPTRVLMTLEILK